jgi:protein-disulfide isomerase
MAKHQTKKRRQAPSRSFLPRRIRGPIVILGVIIAAVAGFVALVTLGMTTQGEKGIERLEGISAEGRTLGDADAPVTIIEFADYQCPHCKRFEQTVAGDLQEEYIATGQVRLEFRNMALMGDESFLAAQAAECASAQGKFWEYHDRLFEGQRAANSGAFSSESLVDFAEEVGLDRDAFVQCMVDAEYEQLVLDETDAAREAGAEGTPFFVITTGAGDEDPLTLQGEHDLEEFAQLIDQKLAQASTGR